MTDVLGKRPIPAISQRPLVSSSWSPGGAFHPLETHVILAWYAPRSTRTRSRRRVIRPTRFCARCRGSGTVAPNPLPIDRALPPKRLRDAAGDQLLQDSAIERGQTLPGTLEIRAL